MALKDTDQTVCSLHATNFSHLSDTYSKVCYCSACNYMGLTLHEEQTICLAFYLSSVSIFSLKAPSLRYTTYLIWNSGSEAGSNGTTTDILKERRPCRHRVCPCSSAMPFSQGSQPLQKNPQLTPDLNKAVPLKTSSMPSQGEAPHSAQR